MIRRSGTQFAARSRESRVVSGEADRHLADGVFSAEDYLRSE
jgi:hypothetical protein